MNAHATRIGMLAGWVLAALLGCDSGTENLASPVRGILGEDPAPKLVVVFVDASASVTPEDWGIYRRSYDALLETLEPGDRLILAPIWERTLTAFSPLADRALRKQGKAIPDNEERCRAVEELRGAFDRIPKGAQMTHILDALRAAQQRFAAYSTWKTRWLVLLSDMLEDSPEGSFAKATPDEKATAGLVDGQRRKGSFPDLAGVSVFAAGATAPTAARMGEVERFWRAYLAETGAVVAQGAYGRDVPGFPPSQGRRLPCRPDAPEVPG